MSDQFRIRLSEEDQEWLNNRADGGRAGDWTYKLRTLIQEVRAKEKTSDLERLGKFLTKNKDKDPSYAALGEAIQRFYKRGRTN